MRYEKIKWVLYSPVMCMKTVELRCQSYGCSEDDYVKNIKVPNFEDIDTS